MKKGSLPSKILNLALPISCILVGTMFYQYLGFDLYLAQLLAFILTLTLVVVFIEYPLRGKMHSLDYLLILLTIISGGYLTIYYPEITKASTSNPITIIFGSIMVISVLESVRRMFGKFLMGLLVVFAIYPFVGPYMPGLMRTRTYTFSRVINAYYHEPNGILGLSLSVAITIVAVYFVLGSCFDASGATEYMSKLATRYFGRFRGGAAKVAVFCSGVLGSVTGNAASNVATTGVITIPMMKKTGYKPETAGAVEAVASTGGIILPPVMGAAGFIMAEFLGVPYGQIILAAFFPALLYYIAVFIAVDVEAASQNLKGLPKEELPAFEEGKKAIYLVGIPFLVLVISLMVFYIRPGFAGLLTVLTLIVVSYFSKETRLTPAKIAQALNASVKSMLQITVICAGAGIIIGSILLTGLGAAFVQGLFILAGKSLFLALLLTALACIILGMGMPAVGVYIILSMLVTPGLVKLGANVLASHMFVFYFGIFSVLTPPVCLAVYVACSIADSDMMKTAIKSIKLAFVAFFAPFIMVYNPAILFQEGSKTYQIGMLFLLLIATVLTAIGINGEHLEKMKRFVILAAGLGFFYLITII